MARVLDVYFHRNKVGQLTQDDGGQMGFCYAPEWLDSSGAVALSQSLPLGGEAFSQKECQGFFGGILPEESKRELVARNLGISPGNDFAMISDIGGECAGAVTFMPAGAPLPTRSSGYRKLDDATLADILRALPRRPLLAGEDGIRMSLAGAQDKLAVRLKNGALSLPLDNAPSTHILKPAHPQFAGLVENEAFCLSLAHAAGLLAAGATTHEVDGLRFLLVERYDRVGTQDAPKRLHQEDFCQALGIPSQNKYQKEGGPGLKDGFALLRRASTLPVIDLQRLLDAVIFNGLIGNNDAHAKNFSLLYGADGTVRLAPLYDLVSTAHYPELSPVMAMSIGGEYAPGKLQPRHFEKLAAETGLAPAAVKKRVALVAEQTKAALAGVATDTETTRAIAKATNRRCDFTLVKFGA